MPHDIAIQRLHPLLASLPLAERWRIVEQELVAQWKVLETLDRSSTSTVDGCVSICDFRSSFGPLLPDESVPMPLVIAEIQTRVRLGIPVSIDQYRQDYPSLAGYLSAGMLETSVRLDGEYDTQLPSTSTPEPVQQTLEKDQHRGVLFEGGAFGQYIIDKKMSQGGMGAIYRARHVRLDRWVALKTLPSEVIRNQELLARFDREMISIGKLNHPNVVNAMDAGLIDGVPYLVMELLEGTDLRRHVIENGPCSARMACEYVCQAAKGLACAHQAGLVHRDVKPANLFLTDRGVVKLLDLGLAKFTNDRTGIDERAQQLTLGFERLGTLDYMSPEQWEGVDPIDARVDLYALGCTLFFLVNGFAPFERMGTRSLAQVMRAHLHAEAPKLFPDGEVLNGVESIYARLMAKDRNQRFACAEELIDAIEQALACDEERDGSDNDSKNDRAKQPFRLVSDFDSRSKEIPAPQPLSSASWKWFRSWQRGWAVWVLLITVMLAGSFCTTLFLFSDLAVPNRMKSIDPNRYVERLVAKYSDPATDQITDKQGLVKALENELNGLSGIEQEIGVMQQLESEYGQARQAIFDFSIPDKVKLSALATVNRLKGCSLSDDELKMLQLTEENASRPFCFYPEKTYLHVRQLVGEIDSRRKLLQVQLDKVK